MKMTRTVSGVLAILLMAGLALAQGAPPQERGQVPPGREQTPSVPAPEEKSVVTHHKVRIGGQDIAYTATAAMYIVRGTGKDRADDGAPKATVFFVYYSKDNVPDIATRPISFVYNGGPGSGSMFTHMGLGPKRRWDTVWAPAFLES